MDTEVTTAAHQAWIRKITVRVLQGVLLLMAVFMAFVLMNTLSGNESDAEDYADCVAAGLSSCDY